MPVRLRPVSPDDIPAMHGVVAAYEEAVLGRVESDVDRIQADLARPGLDPALDSVVADEDGEIVGWAWVNRRSEVYVHPGHRGRGLGGALLTWTEQRARETGATRLVQTVPDADTAATALVRAHGFTPYVTSWLLAIDLPEPPEIPAAPAGVTVRAFQPGDEHAAHEMIEDAFDEWQSRRRAYAEWARGTVERPTFAPECSPVALGPDGAMIGAVIADLPEFGEGYIERLAVRRDQRNRGLARILLRTAFRSFHDRGLRSATLWTHSNTGALALYERVGMTVRRSSTVYALDLAGPDS